MGTPGYYAPEILHNQKASFKSDIFSAGVILFNLLSGKQLFKGYNSTQLNISNFQLDFIEDFDQTMSKFSQQAQQVIESMIEIKPEQRPFARDVLQCSWFDPFREQIVQGLEQNDNSLNQYQQQSEDNNNLFANPFQLQLNYEKNHNNNQNAINNQNNIKKEDQKVNLNAFGNNIPYYLFDLNGTINMKLINSDKRSNQLLNEEDIEQSIDNFLQSKHFNHFNLFNKKLECNQDIKIKRDQSAQKVTCQAIQSLLNDSIQFVSPYTKKVEKQGFASEDQLEELSDLTKFNKARKHPLKCFLNRSNNNQQQIDQEASENLSISEDYSDEDSKQSINHANMVYCSSKIQSSLKKMSIINQVALKGRIFYDI